MDSRSQDIAAIRSCLFLYGTWRQQQKERVGALAALRRLEEQLQSTERDFETTCRAWGDDVRQLESLREQLEALRAAAQAYRDAEAESDRTGEWEPAREAAVALDELLGSFPASKSPS